MAQSGGGSLRGEIDDPGGAVVPGATVKLTHDKKTYTAESSSDGGYVFHAVSAGSYTLTAEAPGFALFSKDGVLINALQTQHLNLVLTIAVQQQGVTVDGGAPAVGVNPDQNASATVINGRDMDGLSDDPTQLQNELQALAGPAAGPDGGEIYIDGFTGGQLPPKSSIREIRVNQNPFSAEFDRIGYGRIEILTKPGSDKFKGQIGDQGMDSALDTGNPLAKNQPPYYGNFVWANVNGPLSKAASYFLSGGNYNVANQNIVNAIDPANINAADPNNTTARLNITVPRPVHGYWFEGRTDFQLGKSNTLTVRESFSHYSSKNSGTGGLSLQSQAINNTNEEFDLQMGDTVVVNQNLINETRFQWRRIRLNQTAQHLEPGISVSGAFVTGGNSIGKVDDHQNVFEIQNNSTATVGAQTIRFGTRWRIYNDVNYSTTGKNSTYTFQSLANYQAQTPNQYKVTIVNNPVARSTRFDGAFFAQDDWRWRPNLTLSYGLRFETQNGIHDQTDIAPRVAIAWAPAHPGQTTRPKTVFRAGYGWFYGRFIAANTSFSDAGGPLYDIQTIHQNGVNQQSFVVNNPTCYDPTAAVDPSTCGSASVPNIYTIAPNMHASLNMQGGGGVDRQLGKYFMANATYLYTRGVHQYLTNNVTAPAFNPATYTVTGPTPSVYNYQYQSGGVYSQHQIILTGSAHFKKLSFNSSYTLNHAKSDAQSVNYFPTVASNPGLDYGRATFDVRSKFFLLGSYAAPHGFVFAPLLSAQSGAPFNITTGNDLTGNNQFNARPIYGVCGTTGVITTSYGCLDSNPAGKTGTIVPYNLGNGPANWIMHLRVSKVIGIGPRTKTASGAQQGQGGDGGVSGRGLSSGQAQIKLDATAPRKYSLTIIGAALNVFNVANYGAPNGVVTSSLFGKSQTLANGQYGTPVPGNRVIFMQALFAF